MEFNNIVECLSSKCSMEGKAIIYGAEEVSYQQLYRYAVNYSEHFYENEVVGIVCTGNIEFVVSYFAVVIAKGVVLLLNKELKWPEISRLCAQCGSKKIVTSENIVSFGDEDNGIDIEMINRSYFLRNNSTPRIYEKYDTDAVVTLLPTSGTTAQAKIVSLTHRSFINGIHSTIWFSGRKKNDTELILLSFATRTALEGQLLTGVALGMQIVLYDGMLVPRKVHKLIEEQQINFCSVTPSVFYLVFADYKNVMRLYSLNSVAVVGEKIHDNVIENFIKECGNINLLYGYGMTETGPIAFKNKDNCRIKLNSVGRVIENNRVFLDNISLDAEGNEKGEIVVCCNSMMKGYYHDKENAVDKGKVYTGDIGHFDDEGYLYIDGRIKNMINHNGYKVFPEEVEGVITKLEEISDVLVRGETDVDGTEIVVADIVSKCSEFAAEDVLRHCRKYLAEYKVPKKIYFSREIDRVGVSQKKKRIR